MPVVAIARIALPGLRLCAFIYWKLAVFALDLAGRATA